MLEHTDLYTFGEACGIAIKGAAIVSKKNFKEYAKEVIKDSGLCNQWFLPKKALEEVIKDITHKAKDNAELTKKLEEIDFFDIKYGAYHIENSSFLRTAIEIFRGKEGWDNIRNSSQIESVRDDFIMGKLALS